MLIESFFAREAGMVACGEIGSRMLSETAHLVRARSVATGAAGCVFQARLGETMGVRGFYHSVLPGKGEALHLLLALSFPRAFREFVGRGFERGEWLRKVVVDALEEMRDLGFENEEFRHTDTESLLDDAASMLDSGLDFIEKAFKALHEGEWEEALSKSFVLVENHMLSYTLHIWGVPDVIVEYPEGGTAAVIEWKSYTPSDSRSAPVSDVDEAQAYVYALLEAERLYGDPDRGINFGELREIILGMPPKGTGAKVIPGVVRLTKTSKANPVKVRHPLLCIGFSKREKCSYDSLSGLLARIVIAAEHLVLTLADVSGMLRRHGVPESLCSLPGSGRIVFRRVPRVEVDGREVRLRWGNPLRDPPAKICQACRPEVKEVCKYYLSRGGSILDLQPGLLDKSVEEGLKAVKDSIWRESWRARFKIYGLRENALKPYRTYRSLALKFGVDGKWIKGHIDTRVLNDGTRLDYFDEASIEDGALVLRRVPTRWEVENGVLVTLREGRPAAVFFRESHVKDPLLRLSFHGAVSSVYYDRFEGNVVVEVLPSHKPSRVYLEALHETVDRRPEIAKGVVALEVNIDLTQLELLGVTAAEIGTARRLREALEKRLRGEEESPEDLLAFYFGGVSMKPLGGVRRHG